MTIQELNNLFSLDSKLRQEIISNLSSEEVSEALEKYYIVQCSDNIDLTRVPQKSENPIDVLIHLHFNKNYYTTITFYTKEEYEKLLREKNTHIKHSKLN